MGTTKAYDKLVEGFRAKISGNISSVKMTPEETKAEIEAIQDGAKSTFGDQPLENPNSVPSQEVKPKKRGRPPDSRNRPKKDAK